MCYFKVFLLPNRLMRQFFIENNPICLTKVFMSVIKYLKHILTRYIIDKDFISYFSIIIVVLILYLNIIMSIYNKSISIDSRLVFMPISLDISQKSAAFLSRRAMFLEYAKNNIPLFIRMLFFVADFAVIVI